MCDGGIYGMRVCNPWMTREEKKLSKIDWNLSQMVVLYTPYTVNVTPSYNDANLIHMHILFVSSFILFVFHGKPLEVNMMKINWYVCKSVNNVTTSLIYIYIK